MKAVFNAFWHGPPLNALHWACMRSFVRRGHGYRLFTYDKIAVPKGVALLDASEVLPPDAMFYFRNSITGKPDLGPFSDLFRYKLLLDHGGWYVDVDTFCIVEEFPDVDRAWAQERPGIIAGGQMALPKGDPLARTLYDACLERSQNYSTREDLGPNLLSEIIARLRLPADKFGSQQTFFPIDWIAAFTLALPNYIDYVCRQIDGAYFLAAYQSLFHYCGIDLASTPPAGSYLRRVYDELAADRLISTSYSVADIMLRVKTYLEQNRSWAIPQLLNAVGPQILAELGLSGDDFTEYSKILPQS